jgi:5-oxoprolinase (ATP-hydrolysing) subunit A
MIDAADAAGVPAAEEAFADRAYAADGTLLPRHIAGAVLTDPTTVAARAVRIATEGKIDAHGGGIVELRADSICLHGDTPGAIALARAVRVALAENGIRLASFANA